MACPKRCPTTLIGDVVLAGGVRLEVLLDSRRKRAVPGGERSLTRRGSAEGEPVFDAVLCAACLSSAYVLALRLTISRRRGGGES